MFFPKRELILQTYSKELSKDKIQGLLGTTVHIIQFATNDCQSVVIAHE